MPVISYFFYLMVSVIFVVVTVKCIQPVFKIAFHSKELRRHVGDSFVNLLTAFILSVSIATIYYGLVHASASDVAVTSIYSRLEAAQIHIRGQCSKEISKFQDYDTSWHYRSLTNCLDAAEAKDARERFNEILEKTNS